MSDGEVRKVQRWEWNGANWRYCRNLMAPDSMKNLGFKEQEKEAVEGEAGKK